MEKFNKFCHIGMIVWMLAVAVLEIIWMLAVAVPKIVALLPT